MVSTVYSVAAICHLYIPGSAVICIYNSFSSEIGMWNFLKDVLVCADYLKGVRKYTVLCLCVSGSYFKLEVAKMCGDLALPCFKN